jgi:pyruvate/2-oxoglutarate/acetoin dehydrogenase E1 component
VVDNGWTTCGAGAEIVAAVSERLQNDRQIRVLRLGFAPTTCPPTPTLEAAYYPNGRTIAASVNDLVQHRTPGWMPEERPEWKNIEFKGPF